MSRPGETEVLRPNVCVVLTNAGQSRVLVFRRVGDAAEAALGDYRWQFPQGGLNPDESPESGLLRELREEIGVDDVDVLQRLPKPIVYRYPPEVLASLRARSPGKARYAGQSQHWFLARLRVETDRIHFDHDPPEFDAFEWVEPGTAVERVVPFKQAAYREALTAFGLLSG